MRVDTGPVSHRRSAFVIPAEKTKMASAQRLEARIQSGEPIVLDGANGTELERLGARMDVRLCSGFSHPFLRI